VNHDAADMPIVQLDVLYVLATRRSGAIVATGSLHDHGVRSGMLFVPAGHVSMFCTPNQQHGVMAYNS
jgi:hypothetical protein